MFTKRALFTASILLCTVMAFGQKNHFIGTLFATGTSFTTIVPASTSYDQLRSPYNPAIELGLVYRFDSEKVFSLQTGVNYRAINNRVFFPYGERLHEPESLWLDNYRTGTAIWTQHLEFPLIFKLRSNYIKEGNFRYTGSIGITGIFPLSTDWSRHGSYTNVLLDPGGYSWEVTSRNSPAKGNIPITLGFDKKISGRSLLSVELQYSIGLGNAFTGQLQTSREYIDLDAMDIDFEFQSPDETYRFGSRNSTLMLKVTYLFATRKMDVASNN